MENPVVYLGTIGQGIWKSTDGGDTWNRQANGLFAEADIRAIAVRPDNTNILFAGTEKGLYRSDSAGQSWYQVDSPMNDHQIWSMAIDPSNPDTLYVGTCPSDLFKSDDNGENWHKLSVELADECAGGAIVPRVTTIKIDPDDVNTIYAGIEIDGFRHSTDGGKTWATINEGLSSLDIHGIAVIPGSPKTLVVATNNDVCITQDLKTWLPLSVKDHYPWPYARAADYIQSSVNDEGRLFIGAGNGPPGNQGGIFISSDNCKSWTRADLGHTVNSTIWNFAYRKSVPGWVMAYSISGQLFRSTDNGDSWEKLDREFGEVRGLEIVPA